ncbi:DUF4856 domain-containing protein [Tenacibaculum pacificus]|uniref:DUF4856 domain-containing protein n=1 Tax=Tenacibaculum pacificus TaxID=3018314 RepID=UPI0022F37EFD|nr:DUF4856 domain-containing protein [Tenacibaculum pacificus]WBX72556.1 DUF4856 domain-containing protein [Tenacibaculum pacificus]
MRKIILSALVLSTLVFTSCSNEKNTPEVLNSVETPVAYDFENVSFSGQVTRLKMADELKTALGKSSFAITGDVSTSDALTKLNNMFADGTGFSDKELVGKKLRVTVASGTNSILTSPQSDELRVKMDGWIKEFAEVVVPAKAVDASQGVAGNLDGKRYVNANGLEANQAVAKTMIGAIMLDQIVNKYVSKDYLAGATADNDANKPYKEGVKYTKLQHAWDEAYGYVFGLEDNTKNPVNSTDARKGFLNSYLKTVESDEDFKGIFDKVNNAFKKGRQAIVVKNYDVMQEQAVILRAELSKVIAVKTVYYLLKGKGTKDASTLHALSEAYGFAHAMKFAHVNGKQIGAMMDSTITTLEEGEFGLWSVSDEDLQSLAVKLASYYGFTADEAL